MIALDLQIPTYLLALAGAFCLGFSKAGFPGVALLNVLIMAELFGAKESVGIILPLLILCDIIVYPFFAHYVTWKDAGPLIGIATIGVIIGYVVLGQIDSATTRTAIGLIVLTMLALQFLRQRQPHRFTEVKGAAWFRWWSGLLMGISTMIANAAAPAYSIYTLVNKFTKEQFLGIGARCFLVVNLVKAPLMLDLAMITRRSLTIDLALIPGLAVGVWVGRRVIHRIPQALFERLLYLFALIAAIRLTFF